jgi:1,2-phenylacetyl-CoA epoxidase catalytic subunit
MSAVNLKNITIEQRTTINSDTYFNIKDNENNQIYFCFQNKLRELANYLGKLHVPFEVVVRNDKMGEVRSVGNQYEK